MAFERYLVDGGSFVAVVNLSNSDRNGYRIGIPRAGRWDVIINSNDPLYDGLGGGPPVGPVTIDPVSSGPYPRSAVFDLPPRSVILLQHLQCPADTGPADFPLFAECLFGPGAGLGIDCHCFDFELDGDNDLADFAEFQVNYSPAGG
jgi:hypothetical protein